MAGYPNRFSYLLGNGVMPSVKLSNSFGFYAMLTFQIASPDTLKGMLTFDIAGPVSKKAIPIFTDSPIF
jgi:hypothetical protein